tara:strand:- start:109 stop:291 length:183 start_codon:yes stop_codon:yes gene_type:complete
MMTFGEWCDEIELRYDRLPRWYLDTARRVTAYREYQARFNAEQPRLAVELSITKGELDGR